MWKSHSQACKQESEPTPFNLLIQVFAGNTKVSLTFPYVTFYLSRTRTILLGKEDPSLPAEILQVGEGRVSFCSALFMEEANPQHMNYNWLLKPTYQLVW